MPPKPAPNLRFKIILPWILLFLFLSSLPYAAAWLAPPEGKQFVGTFVNPDDLSTYLAAIRQGGQGYWLFHFPFSPEPWRPQLMLLPYLLLGKVMAVLGGRTLFWFHTFRLTAVLFSLSAILLWVRTLFPGRARLQLTGWFFIVFGSGVGWLVAIVGLGNRWANALIDLGGPEWSTFMALFHTPHFALGLGLEIVLFTAVIKMSTLPYPGRWVVIAIVTAIASGLTYAYHIPVAGLVIGLYLLALAWQQRRIPWRLWGYGALVLLPQTLMLLNYAILANRDPYFAAYARNEHVIPPPPVLGAVIGIGFITVLAVIGLRPWRRDGRNSLIPIWAAANLIVLYLPIIQFSGRFALGLMVPLSTLAVLGLEAVILPWLAQRPFYTRFSQWTPTPYASLRRLFLFLVVPSTIILPFLLTKTAVTTPDFPTYIPTSETSAANWLSQNSSPDDLILAAYPMGNYLPRLILGTVFLGQLDFTTDLPGKLALVEQFWQPDTSLAWRETFIQEWGIDYIYVGQYEAELGDTAVSLPGSIIYEQNDVIIRRISQGNGVGD